MVHIIKFDTWYHVVFFTEKKTNKQINKINENQQTNKQTNKLNGRVDETKYLNITYTETNIIWLKWDVSPTFSFLASSFAISSFLFSRILIEAKNHLSNSTACTFSISIYHGDRIGIHGG